MADSTKKGFSWKRDYGDGECTEDAVLWYKGNPIDTIVISGAEGDGGYGILYLGNKEVFMADTRKELKEFFWNDKQCQEYLKGEIKGL